MFKDNPLLQQLKQQIKDSLPTAEGSVKATERGFGFLQCDGNKSYFIAPAQMKRVMHGDRVSGVIRETDDGKQNFEPETLIEAGTDEFIGQVQFNRDGRPSVVADHPLINFPINARLSKQVAEKLDKDDWVVAKMLRHPLTDRNFFCEIQQLVAKHDDQFARWKATTARHHLAWDAPQDLESYDLHDESLERIDLTDREFFTIDSESTLDMDDAISIEKTDNGWQVWVAIADPSAYIDPENKLEAVARERGFTLYLPAHTVPMLPKQLANELCSLKPNEKRPVICGKINIDETGLLLDTSEFFAAWIESKHRLNYNDVSDWLEENANAWTPATETLVTQLKDLQAMATARSAWRSENAIVFADRPDYSFDINSDGTVADIHREPRRIGNRLVEETMIVANIAASTKLSAHFGFGVFNTHAGFDATKITQVEEIVQQAGIDMSAEQLLSFEGFCELRRKLDQEDMTYLDLRLRRFYSYSEFSGVVQPHFGLGEQCYGTWTSPIRKYGDLLNHRLLKAMILEQSATNPMTDELAEHLAECRKLHKFAERNMADYLYAEYYRNHLAEIKEQNAQVFDVTRGGIRVRIDETGAVAFVPGTKIHAVKDELNCDADNGQVLVQGKQKYLLGDEIKVKVTEVKSNSTNLIAEIVSE